MSFSFGKFVWEISPFFMFLIDQIFSLLRTLLASIFLALIFGIVPSYLIWRYIRGEKEDFWVIFKSRGLVYGGLFTFLFSYFFQLLGYQNSILFLISLLLATFIPALSLLSSRNPISYLIETSKLKKFLDTLKLKIKENKKTISNVSPYIFLFYILYFLIQTFDLFTGIDTATGISETQKRLLSNEISHYFSTILFFSFLIVFVLYLTNIILSYLNKHINKVFDSIIANIPDEYDEIFDKLEKKHQNKDLLVFNVTAILVSVYILFSFLRKTDFSTRPSQKLITPISSTTLFWGLTIGISILTLWFIFKISKNIGELEKLLEDKGFKKNFIESDIRRSLSNAVVTYFNLILSITVILFLISFLLNSFVNFYSESFLPILKAELSPKAYEILNLEELSYFLQNSLSLTRYDVVGSLVIKMIKIVSPFFFIGAGIPLIIYYQHFFKLRKIISSFIVFGFVFLIQLFVNLSFTGEITRITSMGFLSFFPAFLAFFSAELIKWFHDQISIKECPSCGGNNSEDANICSYCGYSF